MKFDLIIPVYNNKLGLYRSLMSIGTDVAHLIDVTVVDDASTIVYDDIIQFFAQFMPIRILHLDKNIGPGMARQYGIDHTNNPYILFLDCGDCFLNPNTILYMYQIVEQNSVSNLFRWGYIQSNGTQISCINNRMHGKIYRREFLNTHNIRFNPQESYANEDIGFNMAIKMILLQYQKDNDYDYIWSDDQPVLIWDEDDKSLTRANNYACYYSIQNQALANNGGYAIAMAKREGVDDDILSTQIYEIMCDMYLKYLSTCARRPEFINIALEGAGQFYCQFFRPFGDYDPKKLMNMYYNAVVEYLSDYNDAIRDKWTRLDFLEFLDMLESCAATKSFDF